MTPADRKYDNLWLDARTSAQSSEDYYSVIKSPDEPPAQKPPVSPYCTVNKPRKAGIGNPTKDRGRTDDNPYEIEEDTADVARKQSSRRGDYSNVNVDTGEHGGSASASTPTDDYNHLGSAGEATTLTASTATGVYHCLEGVPESRERGDGTGVYHCLDEDPETQAQQGGTGLYHILEGDQEIKEHQGGTGLYHCLEGDQETKEHQGGTGVYHCSDEDPDSQGRGGATTVSQPAEKDPARMSDPQTAGVYRASGAEGGRHPGKCHVSDGARNPTWSTCGGQAGQYHSLDLDGKSSASAPKGGDGQSRHVYSHLKGGGEDTYHSLDRGKRREVIDGDYSHIK